MAEMMSGSLDHRRHEHVVMLSALLIHNITCSWRLCRKEQNGENYQACNYNIISQVLLRTNIISHSSGTQREREREREREKERDSVSGQSISLPDCNQHLTPPNVPYSILFNTNLHLITSSFILFFLSLSSPIRDIWIIAIHLYLFIHLLLLKRKNMSDNWG